MKIFIACAWMAGVAPLIAQATKGDPVKGYWRGEQVTEFRDDGTIAMIRSYGKELTDGTKGKWTVSVTGRNVRIYEITWDDGKSEVVQMTAPYDLLVLGPGSGPGVYGEKVKHLKVAFWSNAMVEISWPGGYQKSEEFPQNLNMHMFLRKGDIVGISLRNLHGRVSFGLQGTESGRQALRSTDFRYTKRFDTRWLSTPDLTGYQQPNTATAKGIQIGGTKDPSVAQAQPDDLNVRALYYKYVCR